MYSLEALSPRSIYSYYHSIAHRTKIFITHFKHYRAIHLEELIKELSDSIKEILSPFEELLDLIKGIPGLSDKNTEDLVAEIGLDMSVFPTEKHLASWLGVCPGNNESAGKKKRKNHTW